MDKSRKLYIRALNKYQNGFIDEAIDICEEVISISIKNKAAINLKGLLYYFKGNLEGSKSLWKLNYEVNNDEVARKYLQNIKEDENRFVLYTKAIALIKELKVKNALELLIKCRESDYNCINVNNAMATCYISMGDYSNAIKNVNRVFELDKNNETSNNNKKMLIKNGVSRKEFNKKNNSSKRLIVSVASLFICVIIGITGTTKFKQYLSGKNKQAANLTSTSSLEDNKEKIIKDNLNEKDIDKLNNSQNINLDKKDTSNTAIPSQQPNKQPEKVAPSKKSIENSTQNSKVNQKTNENSVVKNNVKNNTASEKEGVKYFYNQGKYELKTNINFNKAIDNLSKAYNYGEKEYLYPHVVYLLGTAYEGKKDYKNASKYYLEYMNKFSKGNYTEEVLYRLAIMNKETNMDSAKQYAEKLASTYPNSQYNNSIIQSIIKK